jgi:hypothetical protein
VSVDRQLLLACCRAHWRPQQLKRPVRRDVDWDRLLKHAERLGVAGLLHTTLTTCLDPTRVPPEVSRRLGKVYYHHAARNAGLGARLQEVLAAFSGYGMPVIVLKGASIAELVYGNIALRPMYDLDVLVQPQNLDLADRLVRELGYVPDESWRPADWYRRHHHHLAPYRARDGSCRLELHHHILPSDAGAQLPIEDLWQRARPVCLGSVPTLVLAPADLLLHLCVDLSSVHHFVGGLRRLCDIAAVITRYEPELDWARLLESAHVYALERHLYYGLWLARCLMAADVPVYVLERLRYSARVHRALDLVVKSLIRRAVFRYQGEASAVPAWLVSDTYAELLAAKTGRAKVGGLLRLASLAFRAWSRRFLARAPTQPPDDDRHVVLPAPLEREGDELATGLLG